MTEAIIVALITGGLSLLGVVITCRSTAKKNEKNQEIAQAVMKTELAELTREVRKHNGFAERMPVVEEQIKVIAAMTEDLALTPEMIENARVALQEAGFNEIYDTTAGGTVTAHCGEHVLGILYLNDGDKI